MKYFVFKKRRDSCNHFWEFCPNLSEESKEVLEGFFIHSDPEDYIIIYGEQKYICNTAVKLI